MDNVTATNIAALEQKAQETIQERSADLDQLCAELTAKVAAPA